MGLRCYSRTLPLLSRIFIVKFLKIIASKAGEQITQKNSFSE